MSEFTQGQRIRVKSGSFHNPSEEPRYGTFISYMPGRQYIIALLDNQQIWDRQFYNVRVAVEDIEE